MKTKKIIVASLIFVVVLMISIFTNSARAESIGNITITRDRTVDEVVYKHQLYSNNISETKNVWKLVTCNPDGTITDTINDLYCLRAGLGFTSNSPENNVVEYNQSKNMIEDYESLVTYFSTLTSETTIFDEANKDKFNAVMWVLDHILLEDASDDEVETYLKTYAGYTDATLNKSEDKENVLSRADIEAIQQLVIWYYTNSDETAYNQETLPTLFMLIDGDEFFDTNGEYKDFADIYNLLESYGTERQTRANTLYTTLITSANVAVEALEENENYKPLRDITVFLAGTNAATEQPVVRVKEANVADIALRKFITAVNGTAIEGRAPVVDTSNLNKQILNTTTNETYLCTTATYNHTKDAVKVSNGDTVTYTLRLYNEGEVPISVQSVTDYLPDYLVYIPYGDDTDGNWWEAEDLLGRVVSSNELCKITGASSDLSDKVGSYLKDVLIPEAKYNQDTDDYTLSYVDIQISCQVMILSATSILNTNMTNTAQVASLKDQNGKIIEKDRDSTPSGGTTSTADDGFNLPNDTDLPNYVGGSNGKNDPCYDGTNVIKTGNNEYYPGQEDDDDFEKVIIQYDLALRKFISKVGDTEYDREPAVDTSPLKQGKDTATYIHSKSPVSVEVGNIVTYTLRIYNEGGIDAKVSQIKDYISKNLKYVESAGESQSGEAWWTETTGEKYNTLTSTENIKVVGVGGNTSTDYVGEKLQDAIIPAYDRTNDILSYVDVQVHCEVLSVEQTTKLTNIAEITGMTDEEGTPIVDDGEEKGDPDSDPNNVNIPDDLPGYKDDEIDKPYVPGQEDDDDFEKVIVIVPKVDLALRKFISAVDGTELTGDDSREPQVDTTPLDNHTSTTAIYNGSKKPVSIRKGGLVTFTIRVYNEGLVNAYVSKITDYLPDYLVYLKDNVTNKKYGWDYNDDTRQLTTTITAKDNTEGDSVYSTRTNVKLLTKYEGNGTLDYIDVEVVCQIDENAVGNKVLTNLAQITEIRNENDNIVSEDEDSKPNGDFTLPSDEKLPSYTGGKEEEPCYDGTNVIKTGDNEYYPGQEDDDDFEKVLVKPEFDLALRKFITKVGVTNVNNRYPIVSYEDGKFTYNHTKNPLDVVTGDTVIYTIRVYNEGEADGYANEITDDVPDGLEFLPDNETNIMFRWKLLDEEEKETTDVTKAKYIITDYLSEEQEKASGRINKIKAFDKEAGVTNANPDFRDIEIAFKVTYTAKTEDEVTRTITNTAQISKSSDDDIDSEPNRDEVYNHEDKDKNEDDIDFDRVKVKYFDLSLLKWVSQTKVTLNGKTTVTDTGHTAETSKNESPVKLEVKESQIKKINIKYVYTIRVTNDGEIEGYAKEITDYIPEGLKFEESDNPEWYVIEGNKIGTKALENTLLKPGESAEVQVVLTWINGKNNFGEKVNLAEISQDYNKEEIPDIDSTPNNQVPNEDDIDDAPVIVTIKTGVEQIYVGLILIILVTFAGGIGLIKKYVLE